MVFDPSAFNPTQAPEREQENFTNIAKCVVNKVITAAEAYANAKAGIPVGMEPSDPVWVLEYEALDAQFPDGNKLRIFGTMKLLESTTAFEKRQQSKPDTTRRFVDAGQRAALVSKAYAGHGIVAYPLDPNYDESRMIGNVFSLEMVPQRGRDGEQLGRPMPIPTQTLGPEFIFTGKVRTITPRGAASVNGQSPNAPAPMTRDIVTDLELQGAIKAAIAGIKPDETDSLAATIKTVTPLAGLLLAGKGVGGLIVSETLGEALVEAGILDTDVAVE